MISKIFSWQFTVLLSQLNCDPRISLAGPSVWRATCAIFTIVYSSSLALRRTRRIMSFPNSPARISPATDPTGVRLTRPVSVSDIVCPSAHSYTSKNMGPVSKASGSAGEYGHMKYSTASMYTASLSDNLPPATFGISTTCDDSTFSCLKNLIKPISVYTKTLHVFLYIKDRRAWWQF
jgi:hypothetical protein